MSTEALPELNVTLKEECQLYVQSGVFSCESASEKADKLGQALNDRYRCPENFFDFILGGQLSVNEGYFRFGENVTSYGRTCSGVPGPRAESCLYDMLGEVHIDNAKLRLPFNPTEIIDNLRMERYANIQGGWRSFESVLRKLYYLVRPLTNLFVRKEVQKFHARNWKKQPFPKWPVDTTVEDICSRLLLLSMEAKGVERIPFVWFWPDGASSCLMMTHDVETEAGRDY